MKKDKNIKVCHMTSVHPAKDGRIFHRECTSLAKAGFDVTLVAAGAEDEVCNGVKIVGVPMVSGRLGRILKTTNNVYKKGLELNADIYHLHDPELLPIGLKLKRKGKCVIFDSHEDYCANIKEKPYLKRGIARVVAMLYTAFEKYALERYDGVVSVTPHLTDRLKKLNQHTYQVTNYKQLSKSENTSFFDNYDKKVVVAYVGPIRAQWCVKEIIESLPENVTLNLAGPA